jgi:hypothetical protein
MRAVRYTLIVASTEHELSPGCCRVVCPDLPDAECIGSRRPLSAAAFFVIADDQLGAKVSAIRAVERAENLGVAECAKTSHIPAPAVQRDMVRQMPLWKKSRRFCCCRCMQIARSRQEKRVDFVGPAW